MTKIIGKRVNLRDMALSDLELFKGWMQPHHEWHKTDGPYYPKQTPEQIDQSIAKMEQYIIKDSLPELRQRLVIVDPNSDEIMGMVTRYWISKETNWVAIGISIYDPEHWGKGYGYEALGLWCQYLFDHEPKFVRLDFRTWSGNLGMMRVGEKLGFNKEAVFRMARIVEGKYYDGLGYGILRTEWEARYPDGFLADS